MKGGNRTKFTILGMLSSGNMSGYEIIKTIQSSTNHFWSESVGQIYPTLAKCVSEGLATSKRQNATKSGREKIIYAITKKGIRELCVWLEKTPHNALIRNELLLKIFFGSNIGNNSIIHHILHRQKKIEEELRMFNQIRQELVSKYSNSPDLKYWLITINCGIKSSKAELSWCKESIKSLEQT